MGNGYSYYYQYFMNQKLDITWQGLANSFVNISNNKLTTIVGIILIKYKTCSQGAHNPVKESETQRGKHGRLKHTRIKQSLLPSTSTFKWIVCSSWYYTSKSVNSGYILHVILAQRPY